MNEPSKRVWTYAIGVAFTLACALMTLAFFAASIVLCGFFSVSEDTSWLMFFFTIGIGAFFAAVKEAYPDLAGLDIYDKIAD